MKTYRGTIFTPAVICILLLLYSLGAMSQIIGPELSARSFEVGYIVKSFHRDFDGHYHAYWAEDSFFVRYGATDYLTFTGEGRIGVGDSRYPECNTRVYGFGGGSIIRVFRIKPYSISFSFHYYETLWFDRSKWRYHKIVNTTISAIQIERSFDLSGQGAAFWIAPAYVYDESIHYPWGSYVSQIYRSKNNFGLIVGGDFMLFKHLHPFVHIVYADYIQPRFGVAYQF